MLNKYKTPIFITLATIALAFYFLYPTYKDNEIRKELAKLHGADSLAYLEQHDAEIREVRAKRIKLGLDLQGGMRVVLEVNVLKLIEDLGKNKD